MQFIQSYHRVGQSHADLLVLNVGVVQADRHLHFVKYMKSVLLYLQSWALHTHTHNTFINMSKVNQINTKKEITKI